MSHVVIIGSGLAGCATVRTLRQQGCDASITVISPEPSLFYYPGLLRSLAEMRVEDSVLINLKRFFEDQDVDHFAASVTGLSPEAAVVKTDVTDVGYDYLVIASGSRYSPSIAGSEHVINPLKSWSEMMRYQRALNELEGGSLVIGFSAHQEDPLAFQGGPVFDLLFAIDSRLRNQRQRRSYDITFASPSLKHELRFVDEPFDNLLSQFKRNHIHFLGEDIVSFDRDGLDTLNTRVPSNLTAFVPGLAGPEWSASSGLKVTGSGLFETNAACQAVGHENIYVAGDAGRFSDRPMKLTQYYLADLTGEIAAHNIAALARGKTPIAVLSSDEHGITESVDNNSLICRGKQRNYIRRGVPLTWSRNLMEWQTLRRYKNVS